MTKRLCALGLILAIVAGSGSVLLACGDKFLIHNRGTRFQRASASREPAAILIYTDRGSELLAGAPIDATLRKVGYRPTTVATSNDFEKALGAGGWDLVLVSVSNARAVSERLPNTVAVVPVVVDATNTELKLTKQQYKVVLKAPAKSQSFLEAIDEALARRPKPQRKAI